MTDETIICEECRVAITWPRYNHNQKVLCETCYHASLDAEIAKLPPEVVTICGSMYFYEDMLLWAKSLTLNGVIVLMPFIDLPDADKEMLDALHRAKIDLSSKILVINGEKNGQENYIGESTQSEIAYAQATGKIVEYAYPQEKN